MSRTNTTFGLLQATAAIVALAVLLWSLGVVSFRFAEAANVTSLSDTLSDSAPGAGANHTIEFVTDQGVASTSQITITFPTGVNEFTGIDSLAVEDIDLTVNAVPVTLAAAASGATWGVSTTSSTIVLTPDSGSIGASATVTILIGTNATEGGAGFNQINNPTDIGSYRIELLVGATDTGTAMVAIVDEVTVTASVATMFEFEVAGLPGGTTINASTTSGSTTATEIAFGQLEAGQATTLAQQLSVETNASNGFVVTVQVDGQLNSQTGATIDGFINGAFTSTPTTWQPPSGTLGNLDTYGHWGITTNDTDQAFGANAYVSASTTPVTVFSATSSADGTTPNIGRTEVGYRVEITALQEAADDYEAILTYIATPVF